MAIKRLALKKKKDFLQLGSLSDMTLNVNEMFQTSTVFKSVWSSRTFLNTISLKKKKNPNFQINLHREKYVTEHLAFELNSIIIFF